MSDVLLDVRSLPAPERHPKIFATFDALPPGTTLVVVTDHEPRPLRSEFGRKRPNVEWTQRDLGDGRWEVRLNHFAVDESSSLVEVTLLKSGLFRGSDGLASAAAYRARRVFIKRNHLVAAEGINWPYLGVVQRGTVQSALATSSGREQTMYEVLPDEVFGEIAFLDGGHTPLRFTAVTEDTVVLLLPTEFIRTAMQQCAAVVETLAAIAAQHFRVVVERFGSHLSQPTTARVAQALLAYARPAAGMSDALDPLPKLTHSELAMRAGTVKEVASLRSPSCRTRARSFARAATSCNSIVQSS